RVPKTQNVLATKSLKAGQRLELDQKTLNEHANETIEIVSDKATVAVEVYYDEGFIVPSANGRGAGTDFYTFVGNLTGPTNDLDVVGLSQDASVVITDIDA